MPISASVYLVSRIVVPGGVYLQTEWLFSSAPDDLGSVTVQDWGDGTPNQINNDVPFTDTVVGGHFYDDAGGPLARTIGVAEFDFFFGPNYEFDAELRVGIRLDPNAAAGTRLNGLALADLIVGGAFGDTLNGGLGNDTILGGAGNDRVQAGGGADIVEGQEGADTLYGFDGADTVNGGADADLLNGGNDDDALAGGEGEDTLLGGNGGDFAFGDADADLLRGQDGADTVSGGDGDDTAFGDLGDDLVFGDNGSDTLYGNDGADTLVGGDVSGEFSDANDRLLGGNGTDILFGGAGEDLLFGEAGDDTLVGQDGDDTMYGGDGADILAGGLGRDRLVTTADGAQDVFQFVSMDEVGDAVIGFVPGQDRLQFVFLAFTPLIVSPTPEPTDSGPVLLFDTDTGRLSYDANGSDPAGVTLLAILPGTSSITLGDFFFG